MRSADKERRVIRRWTVAAFATILVATLAVAATYTPLFAASDIEIQGSGGISSADLLALARVDEDSNVFHLDTRAVERRLERDPRILEARVIRSLPDALRIEIVARTPVGVVGTGGVGTPMDLVGADGVLIGPAGNTVDLPALLAPDGGPVGAGSLATAAAAAGALEPALRRAVDAVVVAPDGGVEVRLAAGFSASLGDASELTAKAASLAALLAWVQERDVRVVSADLSVPGSPTAKLEQGSTAVPIP
ncbi:MAG TPA: FtsQ-type POTRA domain-containing protein [Actinomycetota bacterium]|nr:FtsQ-type POTRA domain-containing protein [Actinomycetota bacterium]